MRDKAPPPFQSNRGRDRGKRPITPPLFSPSFFSLSPRVEGRGRDASAGRVSGFFFSFFSVIGFQAEGHTRWQPPPPGWTHRVRRRVQHFPPSSPFICRGDFPPSRRRTPSPFHGSDDADVAGIGRGSLLSPFFFLARESNAAACPLSFFPLILPRSAQKEGRNAGRRLFFLARRTAVLEQHSFFFFFFKS